VEEIEVEIVLDALPDVMRAVEGLGEHLGLGPESLGMTSTFDRLVDTEDLALLSRDHSLRVRQKLENIYAGNEFRLTYKQPLREHDVLFIRNEEKVKLIDPDFSGVLNILSAFSRGVSGKRVVPALCIHELAREANLGPKGRRVNVSVDHCTYSLPDDEGRGAEEYVFEIESHGASEETLLKAADWVRAELGGRLARQSKYPRGLRLLGKL
jgi:CYTH domain